MNFQDRADFQSPDASPAGAGLWSLLQVLKLDAVAFARTNGVLAGIHLLIKQIEITEPKQVDSILDDKWETNARKHMVQLSEAIAPLNLKFSRRAIDRFSLELAEKTVTVRILRERMEELKNRIYDELETVSLYYVDSIKAIYFECNTSIVGASDKAKFQDIDFDIEEAGKCFALGRGTACVFHLMRVMEAVVRALCVKLSIANPDREWGKLLSDMAKAIEPMPKGEERNNWSEALTLLYSVKQAWRNDTMHPNKTYTEEQAEEILRAVRRFIQHLATLV